MDYDISSEEIGNELKTTDFNISDLAVFQVNQDIKVTASADPVYEQFIADVWVGIVLTLMVLSCVCFMCSCLIYHKFQEWKHRAGQSRSSASLEAAESGELPSYTIASGLPTYEEALEQLKKVKASQEKIVGGGCPKTMVVRQETSNGRSPEQTNLSVFHLFGIYNRSEDNKNSKPS